MKWLAPELVQTSNMDCGPAALKCVLEGFGVRASYGRLREACQTDVDGTSIDTVEDIARRLGLDARQVMIPADHVLAAEAEVLPAIAVVKMPGGGNHFVVVWRRAGRWVQVMDPAVGRRWVPRRRFLEDLYVHSMAVAAASWRQWAGSDAFRRTLQARLASIGIRGAARIGVALESPDWRPIAALDAAARMVRSLVRAGAVGRGRQAAGLLEKLCERPENVPAAYWQVQPAEAADEVVLQGAVVVHVRGRLSELAPEALSAELEAALQEPAARPGRDLLRLLRSDGALAPLALAAAMVVAAAAVVLQAMLLRGVVDLGHELGLSGQRLGAIGALLLFLIAMLVIELPLAAGLLRAGRRLEIRLRLAFLEKIPRLGDRYFQSRLKSDMAERSHTIHRIRHLPELAGQLMRRVFEIALTAAGIAWLDPASAPAALLAAAVCLALPLAAQPVIIERDLRVRTHAGALSRFYLDALLGLAPIHTHGAARAVRRAHGQLLVEWARAGLGLQTAITWIEAVQLTAGFGLTAWLLFGHVARHGGETGPVLLLAYWALNLPVLAHEVAQIAWQYPGYRNATLRLLEPLGALEADVAPEAPAEAACGAGMAVVLEKVSVRAAGHTILEGVDLSIEPGSHIAIVGPSGAGKSTLVGLLLGWHAPSGGRLLVDGAPLDGRIGELRRQIAWVDPAVQLWNRSFAENLCYGAPADAPLGVAEVVGWAELRPVLETLPDGMQTLLGEGGALVSGGEGQRVRLARAMLRPGARLVILDEPFRGLAREQRRELLARARRLWRRATLLCITHDVHETRSFERVLVIEDGRIVEDGAPEQLAAREGSRYRAMLDAEEAARHSLWSGGMWRRLKLEGGRIAA